MSLTPTTMDTNQLDQQKRKFQLNIYLNINSIQLYS